MKNNKLFIFEPRDWSYCGGLILVIAESLEKAKEKIHKNLREQEVKNQESRLVYLNESQKQTKVAEFESDKQLSDIDYLVKHGEVGTEEAKNKSCGFYWGLKTSINVENDKFEDGTDLIIEYNYA